MSEILSPIQDYINAIEIVRKNDSLCEGLNLYYIVAYFCSEWLPGKNDFQEKLDDMINMVAERQSNNILSQGTLYILYRKKLERKRRL
ncbi:MAG: hypothetical protein HDR14_14185 [Lachnospiraceae bacterium]|nr:hypothetical protein [Lachnospiraceae bacterium]